MADTKEIEGDARNSRVALFDGIEEGGIRASSLYSSYNEIDEQDNERAMGGLQDRVSLLKRISSDIHEEGNDMDSSRGVLSGTMDKFKMAREFLSKWGDLSQTQIFAKIEMLRA
ncbi:hypothetical protein HN51_044445 [Arachis hypogaea]|uniref:bet1-like SNARE 1-1 isoform X2 n=1 Tax=Arachis hypogaea TaxID=3818 RepID=UPI000DEDAA27